MRSIISSPPKELILGGKLKRLKSSIDWILRAELKDLPSHLEYAFLKRTDKLPVIISKELKDEEKAALLKNVHFMLKKALFWDIKISKYEIEVDKVKLMLYVAKSSSDSVKGVSSSAYDPSLRKETLFLFSKECMESFEILKTKLTEAPILVAPDWDLPFEIMCDASDFAMGAVLGQQMDKYFWLIHYSSKTLSDAQTHYTTTKKELLAMVYAFEKF
ncbi:reverse transcriptase domain-containing protein [Tanacetum coccineum]